MTMPLLDVKNLTVRAGGNVIVDGVSFALERGATLAVVGESGSGKSTLALSVLGLLPDGLRADAASDVRFDGAPLPLGDERAMRALRGLRMGVIFQDPMASLNPFMRIGRQIGEALGRAGLGRDGVAALLAEVELDAAMADRHPHQLSGGQQQRVMIAMALAGGPDLLVADEPTSALDTATTGEIVALLDRLRRERRMATLLISHDLGLAGGADRVAVMERGRFVETGAADAVLQAPKEACTRRLVDARRMLATARPPVEGSGEVRAAAEGLCVDYPARRLFAEPVRAVANASAALRARRTLGILGRSGSGKSTFAQALAAMRAPSTGTVRLLGSDLCANGRGLPRAERRKVQFVFQNPQGALNPRLTVARALAEPLRLAGRHGGIDAVVADALADVGLPSAMAARYPHQLSGGQRQRVCIARALLCDPEVLICDEVVSSLDMTVQAGILALLVRLQRERGFAMAFIGHDVDVVRWISDEIVVMHRGIIVDRCLPERLGDPDRHEETRHLVACARPVGRLMPATVLAATG